MIDLHTKHFWCAHEEKGSTIGIKLFRCQKEIYVSIPKIQQTKMLVTCQRFDDLFLFGLI